MITRPSLRAIGATLALALGVAATGVAADAQTIASGTQINAVLSSSDINSKNAHVGDTFTMRVVPPFPQDNQGLANATIDGHVVTVRSAGQGRTAQLQLGLDRIRFANGTAQGIHGEITALTETKENTTARKGLGAGVGAAVGSQTIGRILGGTLGSVVGIAGGAAAGYAYGANSKPNVNVAHNASAVIQLTRSLYVTRRQAQRNS